MIHRQVSESLVFKNKTDNNADSGIAIFDSHDNFISSNTADGNKRGIRMSVGSSGNILENNYISNSADSGFFCYKGSDLPSSGDGRIKQNHLVNNSFLLSGIYGMKIKEADSNLFENNIISGAEKEGIYLLNSNTNRFYGNKVADILKDGINLTNSDLNSFYGNSVSNVGRYPICLYNSSGNIFINNFLQGNLENFLESSGQNFLIN